MIKLRKDYQLPVKTAILTAWQEVRAVLAVMATGGGKCLAKGTPVLMFDGTVKNVEDIKPGDLLMGPDSKPRTVLSTCRGREEMFRVTPTKGDGYEVNASHILSLKKTGTGEIVNINVRDYLAKSKTFKHTHKGWRAGVDWSTGTYDGALPPYFLGLWLGDGTSRATGITTEDTEVAEYLRAFCAGRVYPLREETISPENNAKTYHIKGNGKQSHTTLSELRRLGLLQNKHIPLNYKTAPRADRLELLAGLVDSDGSLHHNGYDFVFKSKRLAEDVVFVARSLGFAAYLKECRKTCTNTGADGTYWRFNINGDLSEVPSLLPRKQAAPRRQKKDVLKTGIAVESIGEGDYYGFEIDGDHLFMLGDFTVTHNTVVFASIIHDHKGASAAVVHRKEIVVQISCSLALLGVKHRIVAPPATVRLARRKHLEKFGKSFVDPAALCGVASVQTLTSKSAAKNAQLQSWLRQVTLCVFDEGHHYVTTGLWARAVDCMENAKLLQVTACSERADGKGLGVDADGFAEELVEGPQVKWLIKQGYLSPFKYFAPTTDLDLEGVAVTASGDFNSKALRARVVESHIVGDVVKQYLQFAEGKRAIVFATDVATANEMADSFNANGVRAIALDGTTEDSVRDKASADFEHGSLDVLVNVDLFDEGYDVPAAECAILARPTQSLNKFLQMCGRVLRVVYGKGYDLETQEGRLAAIANGGKPNAIIIDPVRNWERHGMPDWPRQWTLAGKEKCPRAKSDTIPQRVCDSCTQPYEAFYKACPYCGAAPEPAGRSLPEQVDGDLLELDVDAMAALFEKMRKADCSDEEFQRGLFARNVPAVGHSKQLKAHRDAKYRREVLRQLVGWWVGAQEGRDLSEVHRRFFHRFGVDIATAFTLDAKQTDALADKIAACFSLDAVLT